jgi:hypothetical protein
MSTPWTPLYFGSWMNFINSLLHNPFLGSDDPRNPHIAVAHSRTEPNPSPWYGAESHSLPWSPAVSFLVSAISLNQVALQMPQGQVSRELAQSVEGAVTAFIDEWCGTRSPGRPWPWPGPNPLTPVLVSALGIAAQSFEGIMREELLQVAGRIVQQSFPSTARAEIQLPSPEEIDAMGDFSSNSHECEFLCQELLDTVEQLHDATGRNRLRLIARTRALSHRLRELQCPHCLPQ